MIGFKLVFGTWVLFGFMALVMFGWLFLNRLLEASVSITGRSLAMGFIQVELGITIDVETGIRSY